MASQLMRSGGAMSLSHHSLVAWQRADDLFIKLHRLSSNAFPASERYGLSSQLRRAAYQSPQISLKDLQGGIDATGCIF